MVVEIKDGIEHVGVVGSNTHGGAVVRAVAIMRDITSHINEWPRSHGDAVGYIGDNPYGVKISIHD